MTRVRVTVLWLALLVAARAEVPRPLPGWKMELMAEAPVIKHPSVVCSSPDGRIFVAEDPMDISTPRADAQEGRIICLHPDGKTTVFADKLYAVFGMQYLEGKLYVLHNPKFSVFVDQAGIGAGRRDLIEQTNPDPWALDWNDHVPANFRLAMDGYFYVAVGDKGLYGARGTDGQEVNLHGGGVVRIKPDGTGLEIFCRGVRNILDVALNEEDEIFTYDNTDEQQWMGRLTHMVDGGFYGYPYDFIPQRPYTLWRFEDYGAGAATGALCYNEDALPEEYYGNLFLADFGKRQVMRVEIARKGGSFAAVKKTDLFPNPPADFRPVGLGWTADGSSMLICDWQHRDSKEVVVVGRLWKLSLDGVSTGRPKPGWYQQAAMGLPFEASDEQLLQALDHSSHAVRLTAQREISRRGVRLIPAAETLFSSSLMSTRARIHALWALHGIDKGASARATILRAVSDLNPAVRRQVLRQLGAQDEPNGTDVLGAGLSDSDASVRFHAATALGRSGSAAAVFRLLGHLGEQDLFARYAVFTALNRIGRARPEAWRAMVEALEQPDSHSQETAEFALRDTFDELLAMELARELNKAETQTETRVRCVRLLGAMARQAKPWRGEWWAYHPVNASPPARTLAWKATRSIVAALEKEVTHADPIVRLAAVQALHDCDAVESAERLRAAWRGETSLEVQVAIVRALGKVRDRQSVPIILPILQAREPAELLSAAIAASGQVQEPNLTRALVKLLGGSLPVGLRIEVISALGELKSEDTAAQLGTYLGDEEARVREASAGALVRIGGAVALRELLGAIAHSSAPVESIKALGKLRDKRAVPALLRLYESRNSRDETIDALAATPDRRALAAYLEGLASPSSSRRDAVRRAVRQIQAEVLGEIEPQVANLSSGVLAELRKVYEKSERARQGPIFAASMVVLEPDDYARFATEHSGNPTKGKAIFMNENGAACLKCHSVAGVGKAIGPDLSQVGTQFDKTALVESILYPSRVVREGYNQILLETADEDVVGGIFKGETDTDVTVMDANGELVRVKKSQIKNRRSSTISLMPEGLHTALTLEEFADLVSYLQSLQAGR